MRVNYKNLAYFLVGIGVGIGVGFVGTINSLIYAEKTPPARYEKEWSLLLDNLGLDPKKTKKPNYYVIGFKGIPCTPYFWRSCIGFTTFNKIFFIEPYETTCELRVHEMSHYLGFNEKSADSLESLCDKK